MKRSNAVWVSLTTATLALTGCGRKSGPGALDIIPPEKLADSMRSMIPAYEPGDNVSGESPPLNAYDAHLGYYHAPCSQWFPYPHDYYDSRWGYYRCGKWSRYNSTRSFYHGSNGLRSVGNLGGGLLRGGAELIGAVAARGSSSSGTSGSFGGPSSGATPPPMPGGATPPPLPGGATPPPMPDYDAQPNTAPKHTGVAHSQATATRTNSINRGGFGSSGKSSGGFFGSRTGS